MIIFARSQSVARAQSVSRSFPLSKSLSTASNINQPSTNTEINRLPTVLHIPDIKPRFVIVEGVLSSYLTLH